MKTKFIISAVAVAVIAAIIFRKKIAALLAGSSDTSSFTGAKTNGDKVAEVIAREYDTLFTPEPAAIKPAGITDLMPDSFRREVRDLALKKIEDLNDAMVKTTLEIDILRAEKIDRALGIKPEKAAEEVKTKPCSCHDNPCQCGATMIINHYHR